MAARSSSHPAPSAARMPLHAGGLSEPSQEPWDRWSWAFSCIWLVFLVFPTVSLFQNDPPLAPMQVIAGVVVIVTFAAVCIWGYFDLYRCDTSSGRRRIAARTLGLQVALLLLLAWINGVNALGVMPFIVAFAVFSLPRHLVLAVGILGSAATLLLPMAAGDSRLGITLLAVTLFVWAATTAVRFLEGQSGQFQRTSEELALVRERERVARDVHDVIGHSLTVVTVKAELAERLLDVDPEASRREIAQIRSLTREALTEVRATVAGLRVARLSDEIENARTALAAAEVATVVVGEVSDVDPRHRLVLAWVLREGVTNVIRHSGARTCRITLSDTSLTVQDDGRGRQGSPEGNGIRGARERLQEAGGTLEIGVGDDGVGTTWKATL